MTQAADPTHGASSDGFDAVRIPRPHLDGEDVCILVIDRDDRCLHATPLAQPLATLLPRRSPNPSPPTRPRLPR